MQKVGPWPKRNPVDFETSTPPPPNGPVPLFPLPGVFLFPHQVLPLHIFEERYRDMVKDLLDGPGRFVIASPQIGEREAPGRPPAVVPVGGLGEILRHEKLPDGRYMIWVLGLSRVHVQEVPSPHLYRQVECLPFMETEVPEPHSEDLARQLRTAAAARLKEPLPLPDSTPPGLLADLLLRPSRPPGPSSNAPSPSRTSPRGRAWRCKQPKNRRRPTTAKARTGSRRAITNS